nr:hypothetical protein [Lachnospiraceae bacterium]
LKFKVVNKMSFWNSRKHKARKEHKCQYCGKKILIGETYNRETGIYESEFNDYCLCERCRWVLTNIDNESDELGDFYDAIFEFDLVSCPSCGSINLREYDMSDDMQTMECECDKCDTKWIADLSIDGLKKITLQQK